MRRNYSVCLPVALFQLHLHFLCAPIVCANFPKSNASVLLSALELHPYLALNLRCICIRDISNLYWYPFCRFLLNSSICFDNNLTPPPTFKLLPTLLRFPSEWIGIIVLETSHLITNGQVLVKLFFPTRNFIYKNLWIKSGEIQTFNISSVWAIEPTSFHKWKIKP